MTNKHYAVGFKDWVEVRVGPAPPDREISEAVGVYPQLTSVYDQSMNQGMGGYRNKKVNKKIVFKAVIYNGGKVLFTLPKEKFRYAVGRTPGKDEMFEITGEETKVLLEYAKKLGKY